MSTVDNTIVKCQCNNRHDTHEVCKHAVYMYMYKGLAICIQLESTTVAAATAETYIYIGVCSALASNDESPALLGLQVFACGTERIIVLR